EHIRAVIPYRYLEPAPGFFLEHRGGERTKALAKLDFQIQFGLHARRARVAEDTASAEGTRTEFHGALKPADNFFFADKARNFPDQVFFVCIAVVGNLFAVNELLYSLGRKTRT